MSSEDSLPRLESVAGPRAGSHYPLEDEIVIGRFAGCDIVLRESYVSRRHASIRRDGDQFLLEDLGSYHGTLINGAHVRAIHALKHDDHVQIGEHVLRFVSFGSAYAEFTNCEHPSTVMPVLDLLHEEALAGAKLRALLEIIENLSRSLDLRDIFPSLLDCAFRIFPQAERGCVLLSEKNGELTPQAVRHRDPHASGRASISRTIARQVMSDGQAVLSDNIGDDQRFQSDSIHDLDFRSMMCAPILGADHRPLGMIQLDSSKLHQRFSRDDLAVLANVANLAGKSVEHARLHQRRLRFERRQRRLETARSVQQHFVPARPIEIPGYATSHYYAPAEEVGGDYFAYLPLANDCWGFAIADVAGKGLPASLVMAHFCGDVRYCMATESDHRAAMMNLNALIAELPAYDRFITLALCVLRQDTHQVTVLNAGHPPPLLRRVNGTVEPIGAGSHGPPLGVLPHWEYELTTTTLAPGDGVLLFTDGVIDARRPDEELYGSDRVEAFLASSQRPEDQPEALRLHLESFTAGAPQADDICIVWFARSATPAQQR